MSTPDLLDPVDVDDVAPPADWRMREMISQGIKILENRCGGNREMLGSRNVTLW